MNIIEQLEKEQAAALAKKRAVPDFAPGDTVRVSLRSLGDVDVRRIAEAEGGGGHRLAAGFTSDDGIDEVVARIERKLPVAR